MGAFAMFVVIVCLALAFGVFLPLMSDGNYPIAAIGFFITMIFAAGLLGTMKNIY